MSDSTILRNAVETMQESLPVGDARANAARPNLIENWLHDHLDGVALFVVAAAFAVRVYVATRTYLNPDEALHYLLVNQGSILQMYRASLTNAHPPLIYFIVYFWHFLGASELMLRMPSVLAGSALCWVAFKWMRVFASEAASLMALIFFAFSPANIALSAEVRAYAVMLLCMAGALYFLAKSLEKNNVTQMCLFSACLYLAILSHYSVLFFTVALGIYTLARIADSRTSRKVILAWAIGQAGAMGLYGILYVTHVSKLKATIPVWGRMFDAEYFHADSANIFSFTQVNTLNIFLFLFAHQFVAWTLLLSFLGGVVLLIAKDLAHGRRNSDSNSHLGILLLFPFLAVWGASLAGIYPYVGSRHTVFLAPFAVAGASYLLAAISGQRLWASLAIALALMAISTNAEKPAEPAASTDKNPQLMKSAMDYTARAIPPGDRILMDVQSSIQFTYYFCGPRKIVVLEAFRGIYNHFTCNGDSIVTFNNWRVIAQGFPSQFAKMAREHDLKPGDRVWYYESGWGESLDTKLDLQDSHFRCLAAQHFGSEIVLIPFVVGQDFLPTAPANSCRP